MGKQKISYFIVIVLCVGLLACRKTSLHDTTVRINITNPVNGEKWANLKYEMVRIELGNSNEELSRETICIGVTDGSGFAEFDYKSRSYTGASNKVYLEYLYFDASEVGILPGEYYSTVPDFVNPVSDQENEYNFEFIPKGYRIFHLKNTNCFDNLDEVSYRRRQVDLSNSSWSSWIQSPNFVGCIDYHTLSFNESEGANVFQIKVTRNGIDSIYYDTFINHPYVTDTFKIFY